MSLETKTIEVDAATALALETRAAELGVSVSELVADLAGAAVPNDLEEMRRTDRGPWSPNALAEDARRYEAFEQNGEGVPWDEVRAWIRSWGTAQELPKPKSRKL